MVKMNNTDINTVAMEVILHAGNGRFKIDEAFDAIAEFDFEKAAQKLNEAEEEVLHAHVTQTKVIQSQASGEETEYSLLFIHAQDTLMTINSELRLAKKILALTINLNEKIER